MNTRSKSYNNNSQNWQVVLKDEKDQRNTNIFNYQSAFNHLKKNYLNPISGVSFAGVNRIYNFYNRIIPIKKIKEFLSKDNSYTLHSKSFKRQYNPSFIRYKGQQIQADLIDIANFSKLNNGTNFFVGSNL